MAVPETTARATAALDELYRQHVGDVYRYTYAVLGNHADAEDVTQTTFVNALRALERGETPEDPSRWLVVIAHNLVRQRWRQAAARPALVELESDVPDGPEDEDGAYELEELVRALQRIPEMQREALVMRELEGRSYREIATLLELSTSALETLLFRARRSLADELENVVTCQNAELAISKRLDGRLSRKERRRLEEHLADCPDCSRLAATEARQRRALKGLALLPLPIGLALFKGAPSAAAATSLPTIGLGTAGAGTSGTGAADAGTGAGTATGGATVGGSLAGGIAVKIAAVAATVAVAVGVGYKGVQALRDTPSQPVAAHVETAPAPAPPSPPAASAATQPTPPQKPAARAQHAVSSRATVAGTEHAQATHGASQPRGQAHEATATNQAGGATTVPTDHATSSEGSSGPGTSGPTHAASANDAKSPTVPTAPVVARPKPTPKPAAPTPGSSPEVPKKPAAGKADTGKAPPPPAPVGSGSSSGTDTSTPAPPPSGSTATSSSAGSPSPSTPPSAPGGTASGGTVPGTTPPASAPPASPPPTTPPPTTPPPSTPPSSTPPSSTPPTTPPSTPPAEQPPGGSGSTGGDTSGSSDGAGSGSGNPSSNAADPWDQGRKLGHHKGNHDDKHPGDS